MTLPVGISFIIGILGCHVISKSNLVIFILEVLAYVIIYSILMWNLAMNNYEKKLFTKPIKQVINKIKGK